MTLYSRDAQGNVMGTYMKKYQSDIYLAGLTYTDINNELLELLGQSAFESLIPTLYNNMGQPNIGGAARDWWDNHPGAMNLRYLDPSVFLSQDGNIGYLLSIKPGNVVGEIASNNTLADEFFGKLCECLGNKSELSRLFLYSEDAYNAFMGSLQNTYPDIYSNYFSTITWNDYAMNGSDTYVWYQMDTCFDCKVMMDVLTDYRDLNPTLYSEFWNYHLDELLLLLQGNNASSECTGASYTLISALYAYSSETVYNQVLSSLGGDQSEYFYQLSRYDGAAILTAIFLYDMSLSSTSTPNLSVVIESVLGAGNSISYLCAIQASITAPQYAQLLQNLQPYSPAILEQTYVNERFMYGSSRLGNYNRQQLLSSVKFIGTYLASGSFTGVAVVETPVVSGIPAAVNGLVSQQVYHGNKGYELSNHLGNVLAVVSDRKTQNATIESATNYNTTNDVAGWTGFNSGVVSWSWGKTIITGSNTKGGQLTLSGLTVGNMYQVYLDVSSATGANIELENSGVKTILYPGKFYTMFKATATSSTMQGEQNTVVTVNIMNMNFILPWRISNILRSRQCTRSQMGSVSGSIVRSRMNSMQ